MQNRAARCPKKDRLSDTPHRGPWELISPRVVLTETITRVGQQPHRHEVAGFHFGFEVSRRRSSATLRIEDHPSSELSQEAQALVDYLTVQAVSIGADSLTGEQLLELGPRHAAHSSPGTQLCSGMQSSLHFREQRGFALSVSAKGPAYGRNAICGDEWGRHVEAGTGDRLGHDCRTSTGSPLANEPDSWFRGS